MKNRIRIIFLLIIASVVGLIIIQGFWIIKFYTINMEQTQREIKLSLEKSVKEEMSIRYADQAKEFIPDFDANSIVVLSDTIDNAKMDSILNLLQNNKELTPSGFSISVTNITTDGDTVPFYDSSALLDSIPEKVEFRLKEMVGAILSNEGEMQQSINLNMIDSLLQIELAEREIDLEYDLEVYNRLNDTVEMQLGNLPNWDDPSKQSAIYIIQEVPATIIGDKEIRLRTVDSFKSLFSPPIVKGSLQAALILLILIVGSYIYMLKTIFDQKKLSAIKNDFINNMTHELKTPIATVSAIIESMQNFGVLDDKEKTDKYLGLSKKELGRLSGLVEKVLNMAREEREALKMNPEELNFRDLCNNIVNSQKVKQEEKDVSFEIKIDEDAEKLKVDRFHMVNVMQNLIENSIKYSGDSVKIEIQCQRTKYAFRIAVSDNGSGIAKKHQSKVFDQFYRVPSGNIHNVKGFGLGLHYVKNIVEKHNGHISLNSEAGKGTTFIIQIPC